MYSSVLQQYTTKTIFLIKFADFWLGFPNFMFVKAGDCHYE